MNKELFHAPKQEKESNETIVQRLVDDIETSNPEIFKNIDNKEQLVQAVLTQISTIQIEREEHHEGPLPAPKTLSNC